MGGALFSQPWRDIPKDNKENLDFVKTYKPRNKEAKHLRILLHGLVGAGKSSFINSVESVLQGRIMCRALTDSTSGSSFTRKYMTYKFKSYPFIFNDIMGFEEKSNGVHVKDIILALRGHVKEGYKFIPDKCMTENNPGYNSCPNLDDKVQVLVSVLPADTLSLMSGEHINKMREVRLAASDMGIPQVAILTKVDKACPKAQKDLTNVYRSKYLKQQVDKFSEMLGLPPNCIFLVKNYESEIKTNNKADALILCALRQMLSFGEDFLDNLPQ